VKKKTNWVRSVTVCKYYGILCTLAKWEKTRNEKPEEGNGKPPL
jgi:hypothetical protein